ncbi:MAG: hypothetical protein EBY16_06060 [Gammaproteobacteria bacterium]|nr:hypothetical protein [Gammaproteobacteria bacterium]
MKVQELATLLGHQKDFFLDGCPITDDVLELVQLTQLNSYNKYCEDWFTLLERYSQQKDRLDKLSPDEFAQLRYVFSMAKPLLKLAYKESEWSELIVGLQSQKVLALVNMRRPHQTQVQEIGAEREKLLLAQQEKVKLAYAQAVIACARTTTIEPDLRTDDVLELKVQELSTDILTLSKAKLIDVYSAYQVQLTQLEAYNKYCNHWFMLLERYSEKKNRLDQLSPEELAELRYFFSMAKPLLKLAYEEPQWQELLCGLQKQGELGLVNMRFPHQNTVGIKKDELERLLIDQQVEVKQAYQQAVIACAKTTTIEPDLRKDKLIRHENCSKFFEQVMQFIRTEIPKYLSPELAKELELKNAASSYPLSTPYVRMFSKQDPMLILKLPKQVADLMWLYNCLFHSHKLAKVMEEATGTVGFGHYGSETKIAGTFLLEVMQLCLYGRPSAQPGFHYSQPRIFIKGYTNSRTTSSTWMLQEWWNSIEGPWSDLQKKMRRENPSPVPPSAPNEHAKIDQKHNFRILIEQIRSLPFLVKYYTGQHQAQPRDVAQLHEKSSRLATHIEGAFNLSWNSFLFELPNLWQCLNGVCQLMHESIQSINQLTYQHFELIRTEMHQIYAAVDALEIDIGLKEGSLLSMVEPFLEAFTQKLLQAMQMPLEEYVKSVSKQDVYAYRLQKVEDEFERLEQDRNELELVSGRLDTFRKLPQPAKTYFRQCLDLVRKSSPPHPHTAGLRDIYQIIEQYNFVRPNPDVVTDQRIIEEDAGFRQYYLDNREDWGRQDIAQDGQPSLPPQNFVFPNNFISFVTLVQAYISGRRESVQMALDMHRGRIRLLRSGINDISDREGHITAYYDSQKKSLITELERDFAQSKSVSESFLKCGSIKTLKDQYSEKIKSHFSADFIDCVVTEYGQKVQEAEVEFQRVTTEYLREFSPIKSKLKPNAQILEKINELKADLIQKQTELESLWTEDQSTKTRKLTLLNKLVLDLTNAEDLGKGQRIFNEVTEQYQATFEATTLQFKRRREILERIHDFKTYLTQLKEVVDSSWTEDNDTIIEKLALLKVLEKSLLSPQFTFANFDEQLRYSELTKMCRADTWMQTLIQYALCLLEYIGLVKSQRHSFFYTLSDTSKEGLGEEQNMASADTTALTCSVA